jgi:hypothetical protein
MGEREGMRQGTAGAGLTCGLITRAAGRRRLDGGAFLAAWRGLHWTAHDCGRHAANPRGYWGFTLPAGPGESCASCATFVRDFVKLGKV